MSTIRINTKSYSGNNVVIRNSKVWIDGKLQEEDSDNKNITIVIEGSLDSLSVDVCDSVEVKGSCKEVRTQSGDVTCGNVTGSIQTMSGDVMADDIAGSVTTMTGDIKCKSRGK